MKPTTLHLPLATLLTLVVAQETNLEDFPSILPTEDFPDFPSITSFPPTAFTDLPTITSLDNQLPFDTQSCVTVTEFGEPLFTIQTDTVVPTPCTFTVYAESPTDSATSTTTSTTTSGGIFTGGMGNSTRTTTTVITGGGMNTTMTTGGGMNTTVTRIVGGGETSSSPDTSQPTTSATTSGPESEPIETGVDGGAASGRVSMGREALGWAAVAAVAAWF